jgi:hypothetical protein
MTQMTVGGADGRMLVNGGTMGVLFTAAELTPAPGDWNGLSYLGLDQRSVVTGLTVEYAGGNGSTAVDLAASITMTDSVVRESSQDGLRVAPGARPMTTATGCHFDLDCPATETCQGAESRNVPMPLLINPTYSNNTSGDFNLL